jgi:uncharacterized protein YwqG
MPLTKEDITALMQDYGLLRQHPELSSFLARSVRMRVRAVTDKSPQARGSFSHLGGLPSTLPPTGWPTWNPAGVLNRLKTFFVERAKAKGSYAPFERMIAAIDTKLAKRETPLHFLGQIDLAELPARDSLADRHGLLLFFADVEDGMCGFDPASAGSVVVVLVDKPQTNAIVVQDSSLPSGVFADASLEFEIEWTIPADLRAHGINLHRWDEESPYAKFYAQLELDDTPIHRLFGHPQEIQNDMRLECEMASSGIYCGTQESYKDARVNGMDVAAKRWNLLAQFDSDNNLSWMWGDAGRLYFWIPADDLRAGRFGRVWGVQQCY